MTEKLSASKMYRFQGFAALRRQWRKKQCGETMSKGVTEHLTMRKKRLL
jgi:PHP family Zn ribbon phosphoesterase